MGQDLFLFTINLFFSGPPLEKIQHAGVSSIIDHFILKLHPPGLAHGPTQALGFKRTRKTCLRGRSETVLPFWKHDVQITETIGIFSVFRHFLKFHSAQAAVKLDFTWFARNFRRQWLPGPMFRRAFYDFTSNSRIISEMCP